MKQIQMMLIALLAVLVFAVPVYAASSYTHDNSSAFSKNVKVVRVADRDFHERHFDRGHVRHYDRDWGYQPYQSYSYDVDPYCCGAYYYGPDYDQYYEPGFGFQTPLFSFGFGF